ncbi:MAG: branched-chain amino acid aminotransferase [Bacteroidia bacterium]
MIDIKITKAATTRIGEVDFSNLVFGKEFSDHIFIADFDGVEWKNFRIQPYGPIPLSPSLSCMHYGQAIFEGMKAYRSVNNDIQIFRPKDNLRRMDESAERMCMAAVPKDVFMEGLKALCRMDAQWITTHEGSSLYLRPFLIASDDFLGIRPSNHYMFMIYGCAVGAYYSEPLKVKVETEYARACPGGVGEAKTAGNYAAALYATSIAIKEGFHQVLWTDAFEHKYLEELGSSNFFVLSGNTLITPATTGTVLKGVTRDSVIQLAKHLGFIVEERLISIDELININKEGKLDELFATGTAATITPIMELNYKGTSIFLNQKENSVAKKLKTTLENIKRSKEEDIFGWNEKISLNSVMN